MMNGFFHRETLERFVQNVSTKCGYSILESERCQMKGTLIENKRSLKGPYPTMQHHQGWEISNKEYFYIQ